MARKLRCDSNPLRRLRTRMWNNINHRTINGKYPDWNNRGTSAYLRKGIMLKLSREEFNAWFSRQHASILKLWEDGEKPSIDRIDPQGHYQLDNIQIISLRENMQKAKKARSIRIKEREPLKYCLSCKERMHKRPTEAWYKFELKKVCSKTCLYKARSDKLMFCGRASVKQKRLAQQRSKSV